MKKVLLYSKKGLSVWTIVLLFVFSCQTGPEIQIPKEMEQNQNFVSFDQITTLASFIEFPNGMSSNTTSSRSNVSSGMFKNIKDVTPVANSDGKVLCYIINYENGGFVIFAADNRVAPILAYSYTNVFSVGSQPEGLKKWFARTTDYIQGVCSSIATQTDSMIIAWNLSSIQQVFTPSSESISLSTRYIKPGECVDLSESIMLPVKSTWGQEDGYNDSIPFGYCSTINGRYLTGCVATAMAQIMRCNSSPANYDWSSMPLKGKSSELARLMRDIGLAVNMQYGCIASGVNNTVICPAFMNDFGYSYAVKNNFDFFQVMNELKMGRPVLLTGGTEFQGYLINGHAWMCDGVYYSVPPDCGMGPVYKFLRMNWGWEGEYNGLYAENNWNPGGSDLNYKREVIFVIP